MNPLIVANWKCNPGSLKDSKVLLGFIKKGISNLEFVEIIICPPSIFLSSLVEKGKISFGAQNCFFEEGGAYTGEISIGMIESLGVKYVILGHSERRNIFKETNEDINNKIKKVINSKVIPILCIGENGEEREEGRTFDVLEDQINQCLDKVSKEKIKKIILAYEPVWAIGTGKFADVNKIQEVRIFLKKLISQKYDRKTSDDVKIVYGGSVDSSNISSYLKEAGMEGVLVGGSSLKPAEFVKMIKSAKAE